MSKEVEYVKLLEEGIAQKRAGEYGEALNCYFKARDIIPNDPRAYMNLGKLDYIVANANFRIFYNTKDTDSLDTIKKAAELYRASAKSSLDNYVTVAILAGEDFNLYMHVGYTLIIPYIAMSLYKTYILKHLMDIDPYDKEKYEVILNKSIQLSSAYKVNTSDIIRFQNMCAGIGKDYIEYARDAKLRTFLDELADGKHEDADFQDMFDSISEELDVDFETLFNEMKKIKRGGK